MEFHISPEYQRRYFLFQALFSMVTWPFNLKMMWAPLVDALYVQKIGRRKSWLIPVQYLIGLYCVMCILNIVIILYFAYDKY